MSRKKDRVVNVVAIVRADGGVARRVASFSGAGCYGKAACLYGRLLRRWREGDSTLCSGVMMSSNGVVVRYCGRRPWNAGDAVRDLKTPKNQK